MTAAGDAALALLGGSGGGPPWAAAAAEADPSIYLGRRLLMVHDLSASATAIYVVVCVLLVIFSGIMAGLTLGLLSLDKVQLEVLRRSGTERDKWLVDQVEPVLRHPHHLLATLLLCNAAAMEALPIFLDRLVNAVIAIIISVTAILIFGEILPQAVCKKYGLQVGAYLAWPVRVLMWVTGIITWPIAKLLDWILGEETALFRRHQLKALVGLHGEAWEGAEGAEVPLTSDEVQVIQGALDMANKTAQAVMTPLSKVFMLPAEAVVNKELLATVIAAGHSRVPVYEGDNKQAIVGILLVKDLLLVDEMAGIRIKELRLREAPFLRSDVPLYDVLKIFRFGRKHMACLTKVSTEPSTGKTSALRTASLFRRTPSQPAGIATVEEVVGICTIEDVLEELLQSEIVDETDRYEDNLQTVAISPQTSLKEGLPPNLRQFLSPRRSMATPSLALTASRASGASTPIPAGQPPPAPQPQPPALPGGQPQGEGGPAAAGAGASTAAAAAAAAAVVANGGPASLPGSRPGSPRPTASLESPPRLPLGHRRSASAALLGQPPPPRSLSIPSLGAAAAASALLVGRQDAGRVAAGVAAGVRAAELQAAQQAQQLNISGDPPVLRPPLPAGAARSCPPGSLPALSGRATPESAGRWTPEEAPAAAGGRQVEVVVELGDVHAGGSAPGASGAAAPGSGAVGGAAAEGSEGPQPPLAPHSRTQP